MRIWATLKTLSIPQFFKLARLLGSQPQYILPSIRASKKALQVATACYGNKHNLSNKANAFRHALWAILLGQEVFQKTADLKKAQDWALNFTNLHEELFVNNRFERAMDLHNNRFGIEAIPDFATASEEKLIGFLQIEAQKAIQIKKPEETIKYTKKLVYILEL